MVYKCGLQQWRQVTDCLPSHWQGIQRSSGTLKSERRHSTQRSSPASSSSSVSNAQLRRTRAAVAEQAALTSSAKQALQQMQLWLENHEEKCYA